MAQKQLTSTDPVEEVAAGSDLARIDQPVSMQRRVFSMAWPVISENFLQTMLGIVDTLLVARLGAGAIAGVGSAQQVMFFLIAALSALSVGSSVLVAQTVGARNFQRASQLARQSLIWSICFSIPLALIGFFVSESVIGVFGLEPEVARIGTEYLQVTMATSVVLIFLLIGGGALRGAGDSKTPMQVTALANVVNVFLSYALIFGVWGFPEMGAVGSAWATFYSRLLAAVLLFLIMWRGRGGVSIRGWTGWLPQLGVARSVLSIGIPAALEQVLISAAFFTMTVLVAGLGTLTLAAHRIAFNALSLSFLPGFGFAVAATALVGQSLGARRLDEGSAAARIATLWAVIWMGGMGIVIVIFAPQLIQFYTSDPTVIAIGSAGMRVVALAQPFWAVLFVQSGALRGLGNTNFPLRVNTLGIWTAVGLGYILTQTVGGGLAMIWAAFLVTAPITASVLWWRFRQQIKSPLSPVVAPSDQL
ncbi:MAG: MATE family efflux transporter [Caldilineaceae bacterium]|nr:MATE family efflux transporter [Caldilineaceae bacterium]